MSDEKIDALATEMREMRLEMSGMRTEMREGFSKVNSRIDKVERKVDGITTLLLTSERASENLTERVTRLERQRKKDAP